MFHHYRQMFVSHLQNFLKIEQGIFKKREKCSSYNKRQTDPLTPNFKRLKRHWLYYLQQLTEHSQCYRLPLAPYVSSVTT